MRAYLLLFATVLLLCPHARAQTQSDSTAPQNSPPTLDTVLVTGEQPGPGLWKVSKDDHVLWILGTQAPLPKGMTWRAQEVEKIIGQSQEVLSDASASVHVGFFRSLTLLPALLSAKKNADGAKLQDVMPADAYTRWLALKARYIGRDNGVERLRPMLAANELYKKAIKKSDLTSSNLAQDVVDYYAKKNRVPVVEVDVKIPLEDPKQTIADFKTTAGTLDIACLETTMARLETDLGAMRQRANAWAIGDLQALRNLPYPDQRAACLAAIASNPHLAEEVQDAQRRVDIEWLAAAEAALAKNNSTLALMPITELFKTDGRLARLRAKGYVVEDPQ